MSRADFGWRNKHVQGRFDVGRQVSHLERQVCSPRVRSDSGGDFRSKCERASCKHGTLLARHHIAFTTPYILMASWIVRVLLLAMKVYHLYQFSWLLLIAFQGSVVCGLVKAGLLLPQCDGFGG